MSQEASLSKHASRMKSDNHAPTRASVSFVDGLLVNKLDLRIPMAARQPGHARSIQAIVQLAHVSGGFRTFGSGPLLRAGMQFNAIDDLYCARQQILRLRNQLIGFANTLTTTLIARSGSCKDVDAHVRTSSEGATFLEIELLLDVPDRSDLPVVDAMIAKMASLIEQLTRGNRVRIAISSVAERQLLYAQLTLNADSFSLTPTQADAMARRLVDLHDSSCRDATAVGARNSEVLAAANAVYAAVGAIDRRAGRAPQPCASHIEPGPPLASWYHDHHGHLSGRIMLPLQMDQIADTAAPPTHTCTSVATGSIREVHPIEHAVAAIALAQSLANLHAHATGSIVRSNPAQHALDLALMAGARGSEIEPLVQAMLSARTFRFDHAVAGLDRMRTQ